MPYTTNTQVGAETAWSPSLTFAMPTPIAAHDTITVDAQLGALPAQTLPEDMTDVWVSVWNLEITSEHWNPLRLYDQFYLASFDKDSALVFPALEYDTDYVDPGIYHHKVKSIELLFTGKDGNGDFVEYSYECDQVVNPQPILTTAVYDLSATPELVLDRTTAQVGEGVGFTGMNLLAAAPANPRATASVTIGGRAVGTVEVDDSGSVQGTVVVPAGLAGTVEVRVANGPRSASALLSVSPAGGGAGGVDVNDPSTWHPNAQSGAVDHVATLKVAAKKIRSGKKLKLGGAGFAPGEAVIIKARGGKGRGARSFNKVVYANAAGSIKTNLRLKGAARGKWRVTAIGVTSGHGGKAVFSVR
ncbi:hypothetical protein [Nocardioides daeguensis]|uniref:IPT/TIG domain-containing protein n=1 Tax=Nocardioides daeguensis TaxID=908359 RepID=A0ABP6VPR1_9ACTN|nr:hypothetical protein [Nocardioides daeguensis]MBV6727402.1 hypothetical protein [Nocardioides daeguensis]MCR1775492.1 hypothetical protein [Nocardioides daeguensis]